MIRCPAGPSPLSPPPTAVLALLCVGTCPCSSVHALLQPVYFVLCDAMARAPTPSHQSLLTPCMAQDALSVSIEFGMPLAELRAVVGGGFPGGLAK